MILNKNVFFIGNKRKKNNRHWPNIFIQGVSLLYIPVQYGWLDLFFSIVNPRSKQWFWALNQSCEISSVDLISVQNRNETTCIKIKLRAMVQKHVSVILGMSTAFSCIIFFKIIFWVNIPVKSVVVDNIKRHNWYGWFIFFALMLRPKKETNTYMYSHGNITPSKKSFFS